MAFLDSKYLLDSPAAEAVYAQIENLPIIDPHNHCDVKALAENRPFADIWEAEGATDHYVWELMRKSGVPEELITGKTTTNRQKWDALAQVFDLFAGNPTYEWIHLDLKRRLGIDARICADNAAMIWDEAARLFAKEEFTPQSLIMAMNVEAMCSTDDPADTLEWHEKLASSPLAGRVRPTFRPDAAMNIANPNWNSYVERLGKRWETTIDSLDTFLSVLAQAHEAMGKLGCRASDHGIDIPYGYQLDKQDAQAIFNKVRGGAMPDPAEVAAFKAFFLNEMAELDAAAGRVYQLHMGVIRDVRKSLFDTIGVDAGGDLGDHDMALLKPLLPFLNRFDNRLDIVLYNMTPCHNATLAMLTRAFGGRVCLGSAWWLNDSVYGMRSQLELAGSIDLLSNMSGMVSDSRKILSYGSRFEMYRRTLASVLGTYVQRGQIPQEVAVSLGSRLAYHRPKEFFGFQAK